MTNKTLTLGSLFDGSGGFPLGGLLAGMKMDDPQAPPIGTKGTVLGVDDIGSAMVAWDNGSRLSVVYGEDSCRVISNEFEQKYSEPCEQ